MKVFIVSPDKGRLKKTNDIISDLYPDADVSCFNDPMLSLSKAREGDYPDVAFLEPDMPELSGLDLAAYLKDIYPYVNIIMIADDKTYAYDAIMLHSSGYIKRPVSKEAIKHELDDLRYPGNRMTKSRVYVQTFGDFEIFADGEPISFKYSRTKEVVAVLVNNRGAQTTNGEIIASLWEDDGDPDKKLSYLRNLRQDLQNTLKKYRLEGIILKQRGSMSIVPDRIECDLYDWLEKKKNSRYSYTGDYMNQYSWPEFFHAELDELSYELDDD